MNKYQNMPTCLRIAFTASNTTIIIKEEDKNTIKKVCGASPKVCGGSGWMRRNSKRETEKMGNRKKTGSVLLEK